MREADPLNTYRLPKLAGLCGLAAVALFAFLCLAPCARTQAQGIPGLDIPAPQGLDRYFREVQFRRGDFNTDRSVDISDAIATFVWLFAGGQESTCTIAGDTNGDSAVDLSDGVFTLAYLFRAGAEPAAPGPFECGLAPEPGKLSCDTYPQCSNDLPLITHVLNRITFGPTEELLTRIQTREDLLAYIEEQLNPPGNFDQAEDEPGLAAIAESLELGFNADYLVPNNQIQRMNALLLSDAINSRWQLMQVLSLFWNNHFHTQVSALRDSFFSKDQRGGSAGVPPTRQMFNAADSDNSGTLVEAEWNSFRRPNRHPGAIPWERFPNRLRTDGFLTYEEFITKNQIGYWKYYGQREQRAVAVDMELREYNFFRRNAFGDFRDLLEGSAKSVAQVIYLNNFENINTEPNENYAREYFELFALGADQVYTQRDIEELAKVFTGWTAGWVLRDNFPANDILYIRRPGRRLYSINDRETGTNYRFATTENWDDDTYTWAFHFGNPEADNNNGHVWGRKDIFLPRYGGVDSLGNPVSPLSALQIPNNANNRTNAAAMDEFDQVLDKTISLRDCAKYICTKLIQLLVTDDISDRPKTGGMPDDLAALFNAVDRNSDGRLSESEWAEPTPDLPNGRPPQIFEDLDSAGNGTVSRLEFREPDLLLAAIDAWRESEGDIGEVLRVILFSDEFLSLRFYRAKVKTPIELVASTVRALGASLTLPQLLDATETIENAGMVMVDFPDPTGESEMGFDWMHTVGLLNRLEFINDLANPLAGDSAGTWDPNDFRLRWQLFTPERTVKFFTLLFFNGDIIENHRALSESAFNSQRERNRRISATAAFLLSLPQFQKQ